MDKSRYDLARIRRGDRLSVHAASQFLAQAVSFLGIRAK
jgi:hypothetical protein